MTVILIITVRNVQLLHCMTAILRFIVSSFTLLIQDSRVEGLSFLNEESLL